MRVVLAGGSGALERRLAARLSEHGHDVAVLTRSPQAGSAYRQLGWDGRTVGDWAPELADATVINLAGALVDRRPTAANVDLLTRSRVEPTRALAAASREHRPTVWLQMSTLAIYGDAGEAVLDESAEPARGPAQMAGVATAWEAAATEAVAVRQVMLRTAVVLDPGTPAFNRLVGLTKWGLGGRVGSGRQWFSWLHIADYLAVVDFVVAEETLTGVVHATSPHPVRNTALMAALRAVVRRPPAPPTPEPLVRLGSVVLRTDPALALTGRRCVPARLQAAGFDFSFPDLRPALADLMTRRS